MNADRDRDRQLDDILTRALRVAGDAPATDACLDAETAAAWMDGGLDSHGIALAEAHASNCARCQALLGAIAQTTPVALAPPQGARLWRWWFAPLAATAAAVTIWIVVPQQPAVAPDAAPAAAPTVTTADAPRPVEQEIAKSEAAPPPPPAATARETQPSRERPNEAPARADAGTRKRDAQSFGALEERKEESAKLADATAEGRVAAAAPAAPSVALQKQLDPVADATARSSPSPNVIWLVARGGMVHLATDGRTFVRLPFPEAVDLTAVTATDERRAVVTAADGRTFQTDDGGQTWRRLQEIPAGPF